jgi:ribosomal protein L29
MKKNAFKGKSAAELTKMLAEKREELRTLRFAAAGARAKDPSAKGKLKADIARIMTELTIATA